ncbi:MAG: flagellar basal body rod protein FlgB [Candidatus Thiodiazotropha sp. (ex Epidulcina cf. delphinae)]|nr:flagellar basal body rod protein FlgB [Candidatus Thiodiazotropha sp. (ex Epidulcina cf. delphinae)]
MIIELSGATSQIALLALDASSMQHNLLANNIANSATPGFNASRLDFEAYMRERIAGISDKSQSNESKVLHEVELAKQDLYSGKYISNDMQEGVQIDQEMIKLTKNVLKYQALLAGLNKVGAVMKLAINEGKS